MTSKTKGTGKNRYEGVEISMLTCLVIGAFAAEAAAIDVYGVGYKLTSGLPSELYRFDEDGPMEQRWDIPESRLGWSLATVGFDLYVGEYGGAIDRYDLNGNSLGQFADVSGLAGPNPLTQKLESDAAGSVYTAFGGFDSSPRTSFRIASDGSISETFSQPNLVFPSGIDATAGGEVYIINSAAVGVGNRLFKFGAGGSYIDDFPIPQVDHPSDIAIDEMGEELFISDEFPQSIHVFDISSGAPIFSDTLPAPGPVIDVFVEPISGRIFGTYYEFGDDGSVSFFKHHGFEVSRGGSVINLYVEDAPAREQSVISIVAVAP